MFNSIVKEIFQNNNTYYNFILYLKAMDKSPTSIDETTLA